MSSSIPPATNRAATRNDPLVGALVNGKFQVTSLVAAGGMGKIYRAEQLPLNRPVALKILHAQANGTNAEDPQFKKRFLREASILARLQHPNIVTVFDYGAIEGGDDERYFMAMEFLSGQTLARRIAERGPLSVRDTIRVGRQIARGLTEAHAQGIIHRDLKPSNVMLVQGRDGEELVKILDFGIVKIIGEESLEAEELTQEGAFIGSPKYMAPEQIQRGGKIDVRTDVYSFGIILYQCLCGSVPFDGASSIQTLMAHLNQAPEPLRERAPALEVPEWLEHLVMTCIEKEPARRPQAMDGVARTLAEAEAVYTSGQMNVPGGASGPHAAFRPRSASMPEAPSATIRASDPGRAGLAGGSGGARGGQSGGHTVQGTIASVHPTADDAESDKTRTSPGALKPARRSPVVAIAGIAAVVAIAWMLLFVSRGGPAPAPAAAPPPAPTAAARRDFAMTIESTPSGAEVKEGDRVLGTTPLQLTIDNDGARLEPRRFTVTKDGYVAYSLVQGPSQEPVRVAATLVAQPSVGSAPPATPAPSTTATTATTTSAPRAAPKRAVAGPKPSAAPSNGLDIRLTR